MIQYQDRELERKALGSYIADSNLVYESKLIPEYFYNNQNKLMFEVILDIKNKDEKIDIVSVSSEINKKNNNKWLPSDISELLEYSIFVSSIESIERELILLYEKRRFLELVNNSILKLGEHEDIELIKSDLLNNLEGEISTDIPILSIGECAEKAIEITEEAYKSGGRITGMQSGYQRLDAIINGFEKPCYMVIGARPGVGKTAFSLELARRLSENNKILYFSLEMPFEQLGQRVLANRSKIPLAKIKKGNIEDKAFNSLLGSAGELYKNNCKVVEKENLRIEDLVSICKTYQRKNGLDGIVIDYFTLLKSYKQFRDSRLLYKRRNKNVSQEIKDKHYIISSMQ